MPGVYGMIGILKYGINLFTYTTEIIDLPKNADSMASVETVKLS